MNDALVGYGNISRRGLIRGMMTGAIGESLVGTSVRIKAAVLKETQKEAIPTSSGPPLRWWKGNLQTQSYWSDGDLMPEDVVGWYKEHGFHFVAPSDHDHPPVGERWKKVAVPKDPEDMSETVHPEILAQYRKRYGDDWVQTRMRDGVREVRLKPVSEFGPLVNESHRFLVMPSHQIYTHVEDETGRVHPRNPGVAWFDIANSTAPVEGARSRNAAAALQQTFLLVQQSATETQRRVLLGLAHPNYRWQLTAEDIVGVDDLRFMEIYTALSMCNSQGDARRASAERIWDIVLARRLGELNKPVIYGLASDDAHTFGALPGMPAWGRPGRGWIMVRSRYLSPESIFQAMERGDFYASSGVVLDNVCDDGKSLTVTIRAEPGVSYITQFIGTLCGYDRDSHPVLDDLGKQLRTTRRYSDAIGQVLHETAALSSTYKLRGKEMYVRAKIISNRAHPEPSWLGQVECVWTQPLITGKS